MTQYRYLHSTTVRLEGTVLLSVLMELMMIVIIMIAFKGAVRDLFYNLLTVQRTTSSTYAQVAKVQSCANYVQHIECLSSAMSHVPLGMKGQLIY